MLATNVTLFWSQQPRRLQAELEFGARFVGKRVELVEQVGVDARMLVGLTFAPSRGAPESVSRRRLQRVVSPLVGILGGWRRPASGHGDQFVAIFRPVMQRLWVEVSPCRPLHRSECRVEFHRIKDGKISERRKHFPLQHGPEVNPLFCAVVEP